MPGYLFHATASAQCPHGGMISTIATNSRVLVNGLPVATLGDSCIVTGCAFNVSSKPSPCIKVQWLVPAARVQVNGQPVILQTSTGICLSPEQVPQGPPVVTANQMRVSGI